MPSRSAHDREGRSTSGVHFTRNSVAQVATLVTKFERPLYIWSNITTTRRRLPNYLGSAADYRWARRIETSNFYCRGDVLKTISTGGTYLDFTTILTFCNPSCVNLPIERRSCFDLRFVFNSCRKHKGLRFVHLMRTRYFNLGARWRRRITNARISCSHCQGTIDFASLSVFDPNPNLMRPSSQAAQIPQD